MDYVDMGSRVRKQRQAMGLTQEELAEKINVSTSFIGHVERGSRKGSMDTVVALANALNVSMDYLLSASLNNNGLGPMPQGLSKKQKDVMHEILSTLQNQLGEWNKD
ncbi:MAG: helix-turn-helix transcriptional regulator [Eubacteriales bacterium]|nr:helix-turn-helix transcriptional regulator [Eubacteriales bacterium]